MPRIWQINFGTNDGKTVQARITDGTEYKKTPFFPLGGQGEGGKKSKNSKHLKNNKKNINGVSDRQTKSNAYLYNWP